MFLATWIMLLTGGKNQETAIEKGKLFPSGKILCSLGKSRVDLFTFTIVDSVGIPNSSGKLGLHTISSLKVFSIIVFFLESDGLNTIKIIFRVDKVNVNRNSGEKSVNTWNWLSIFFGEKHLRGEMSFSIQNRIKGIISRETYQIPLILRKW